MSRSTRGGAETNGSECSPTPRLFLLSLAPVAEHERPANERPDRDADGVTDRPRVEVRVRDLVPDLAGLRLRDHGREAEPMPAPDPRHLILDVQLRVAVARIGELVEARRPGRELARDEVEDLPHRHRLRPGGLRRIDRRSQSDARTGRRGSRGGGTCFPGALTGRSGGMSGGGLCGRIQLRLQ